MELPEGILSNNYALIETCNYFTSRGHEVYLLAPKSLTGTIKENFKYVQIGLMNHTNYEKNKFSRVLLYHLDYFINLIAKIIKISPDLIICNGTGYYLYLNSIISIILAKILKIPHIQVWIGSDLILRNKSFNKTIKKRILTYTTINLVLSYYMKKIAININSKANLIVIPNKGVDLTRFTEKQEIKTRKTQNDKPIKLLYVGRLNPIKGLSYLIKAFKISHEIYPNMVLEIVGDGIEKKKIQKQIEKYKLNHKISMKGSIAYKNIAYYYQNSDVFVLPSLSESFGNVLLEAQACGLPIITTNVGALPDLIDEERGGLLVPARNSILFSNAILKLVKDKDLRKKMGQYNLKSVKKFASQIILKKKAKIISFLYDFFNP
jgi:glycosyltransferase involved in cell wall biosynthesis